LRSLSKNACLLLLGSQKERALKIWHHHLQLKRQAEITNGAAEGTPRRVSESRRLRGIHQSRRLRGIHQRGTGSCPAAMIHPRCQLVSPSAAGAYHCVHCAGHCGDDPLTERNFDHRYQSAENRLALLAGCFAISVHSFAVMSNHLHAPLSVALDRCKH